MVVAIAFVLLLFMESARRQHTETLALQYQYALFAIRDDLREEAMRDPKVAMTWVFQYLDSTIAKSISLSPALSIWQLLGLFMTHRNDDSVEKLRAKLEFEYKKPQNQQFKRVEEKLMATLGEFLIDRHILALVLSVSALVLPFALVQGIQKIRRRSLELVVESPETSTLSDFVTVPA
ncbi:MAG: hypothetical protein WBE12_15915 [Candidatus Acidiferrum sp.]